MVVEGATFGGGPALASGERFLVPLVGQADVDVVALEGQECVPGAVAYPGYGTVGLPCGEIFIGEGA